MVVSIQQIQKGVNAFVENEIASKTTGFRKFGVYFLMPTITNTVADYVNKLKQFMPDAFDGENVRIETLYNVGKGAIQKSGQFEFMGLIFNETDIDKLYSYIKQQQI